jgi:hypothetical protein
VLVGDLLYITNQDGKAFVLKTGPKFKVDATNSLEEGVLATPPVSGRLWPGSGKPLAVPDERSRDPSRPMREGFLVVGRPRSFSLSRSASFRCAHVAHGRCKALRKYLPKGVGFVARFWVSLQLLIFRPHLGFATL